ncbi:DUF6122 family protein [Robertkochia solimangrovi]|uniref:DUF6122 family protein n=1 Tax=Robertkochia solimangrovi TaxID=2213046 RepID=UPI00117C4C04|nr:DUF6122 family protein [Robertkochia solimangrovi]TRZ43585.1 hypothetical protein DMZ48_09190 [Robertkochia solimangrovi]
MRPIVHYGIHFLVPVLVAWLFYRESFRRSAIILLAGIIIDIDHLLAHPIFDPDRCSIGFHILHTYPFIVFYLILALFRKTRLYGLALMIHIIADTVDCWLNNGF